MPIAKINPQFDPFKPPTLANKMLVGIQLIHKDKIKSNERIKSGSNGRKKILYYDSKETI